jgi:hypothetical protein
MRILIARALTIATACAVLAYGAEMHGTWAAASTGGPTFGGAWTAVAHQESGGVTGTWALYDAGAKIVMQGGWSASKSPRAWNGAWRATVTGRSGDYSGTWTGAAKLPPDSSLPDMLESALRAVVTGGWKSGAAAGSWSIRAMP